MSVGVIARHIESYISYECGVRKMSPDSIRKVYLGAIANGFSIIGASSNFRAAMKTESVKFLLRGFTRIYESANPKALRTKTPFTLSMVEAAMVVLRSRSDLNIWERARIRLALRVGIHFLLRRSEFLGKSIRDPGISRKCILFFTREGGVITYSNVGSAHWRAESIHLNIRFSKTDQSGVGRILQHRRQISGSCIVKDMENWIRLTRDAYQVGEQEDLFTIPGMRCLTSQILGAVMKDAVHYLGLDSSRVSAHSLRYGGATMLAAAGLPQYILSYYGRCTEASESLKIYAGPSVETVDLVSSHMSRMAEEGIVDSVIRDRIREAQARIR